MVTNIQLIIIDPQYDFCDPKGSLFVTGADGDMQRVSAMVNRLRSKLSDIHITLDSHRIVDISHPIWWKDGSGKHPNPFTLISPADVEAGTWTTTKPSMRKRSLQYLKDLETRKRYPHVIWPEHCRIGTLGATVVPVLQAALDSWERERFGVVDFVTKGSNPWTEHFSAVMAEVPDPEDPTTQINTGLIQTLEEADIVLVAGEARSHCLANTVRDIVANFGNASAVEKMHLISDGCSDVPSFEKVGNDFVTELTAKGMKITTSTEFLA